MPLWYFVPVPELDRSVSDQSHAVTLVRYLTDEGQWVEPGTPIATVETWWAVLNIEATTKGMLKRTILWPDAIVRVGEPIAIIVGDGEDMPYDRPRSVATVVRIKREKPKKRV